MRQLWICALAASLAITGCGGGPTGPRQFDLVVATDKPEYSLDIDSLVRVTLTNRSHRVVYLPMGSYVVYERLRAGDWRMASPGSSSTALGPHSHSTRGTRSQTSSSSDSTSATSQAPTASGTLPTRTPT